MSLAVFRESLDTSDTIASLRNGLIGENSAFSGPFGEKKLVYADYTASGRALRQVEHFIAETVLPFYANSHTEASHCGAFMTRLRNEARCVISSLIDAGDDYSIIFAGSGATAGLNKLVHLLDLTVSDKNTDRPLVLSGPYEHHSNILPWRESGVDIIAIPEADGGGPDLHALKAVLEAEQHRTKIIGSFSAASNVTGLVSDVAKVTRLLKQYGALSVWDYAGGGPYLPISVHPEADLDIDALVISPHKFPGGPGASGILVLRNAIAETDKPSAPGGGTVTFVSPWDHDYSRSIAAREESGTPNVIGDIRAAMTFLIKDAAGQDFITRREEEFAERAFAAWSGHQNIKILAADKTNRLPIFSFQVFDDNENLIHPQLFTRMLSDHYGIQARGGCACAGPYAHQLLGIGQSHSQALREAIRTGREIEKPGWTRLNFSYLMTDETAQYILRSVVDLAETAHQKSKLYQADCATARFKLAV